MLRNDDWIKNALVTGKRKAEKIIADIPPHSETALLDNAARLSKQANKYSQYCGLVLLCNYQNMIALDFTPGRRNERYEDVKNPVKYCWSDGVAFTHKKFLIAALVYGLRKANLLGSRGELSFHHLEPEH